MKEIIQYLAAIAKRGLAECECRGTGRSRPCGKECPNMMASTLGYHCSLHGNCDRLQSCPFCADLRRVAEMAKWGSENNGNCKLTSSSKCTGHCDEHCPSYTPPNHFWIKNPDGGMYRICRDCGISTKENDMEEGGIPCDKLIPTLTIPELRSYMEIVGVWRKFKHHLWNNTPPDMRFAPFVSPFDRWFAIWSACMDAFTSPAFFEVAARFLKGEAHDR